MMGSSPSSLRGERVRDLLELEVEFLQRADYLKWLCSGGWEPHVRNQALDWILNVWSFLNLVWSLFRVPSYGEEETKLWRRRRWSLLNLYLNWIPISTVFYSFRPYHWYMFRGHCLLATASTHPCSQDHQLPTCKVKFSTLLVKFIVLA